ncbi:MULTISPECIES: hypothetical protein [Pseudomonas syringae group]|uniref:hypothetical protein n=1 Tax=Pseudomonas syringae group TaxID=136849 RepID=UPI000291B3EF|nr:MULTISPECIES: hypothetical protein [Pseudomonas syringae group]MCF9018927.1 hypothetical protein [Pseudomonas syringae]EKN46223.1 hypothetical protein AAI_12889 [Pseudomonas viridiflava UASWS0038]MEE3926802.1 hypothetical protein [Pseudomonas viridiflava]MEE3932107.1 hypothetical protein [Pseudomonas viridiflava]MEE3942933.1 hypothetical protein [Pseudomonas viridiflava]
MKKNLVLRFAIAFLLLSTFTVGAEAASSGQVLCPSKDISKFVDVFAEDAAIQKQFTIFPLKKIVTVDAEPEPKQETQLVAKENASFPLIPEKSVRTERGLTLGVVDNDQKTATIKLEKPDTDYQVLYVFKLSSCWFLDEVKDYSL